MMSIAGIDVTFEQMRQRSCAAANMLTELGVGRGDCVALFTATCPEWVYFWLGAARIGAVSAAVNAANKGDFLLHTLRLSQAKVILTDADRRPRIDEVADRLDTVTDVVVQDDSLDASAEIECIDRPPVGPRLGDRVTVGALFYTSGTTGPSKAVATTWHYLFSVAATVASAGNFARARCCGRRCRCFTSARRPACWLRCWSAERPCWPGFSPRRGVGRRPRPRCHRFRRCRGDGFDAAEPARRSARRAAAVAVHLGRAHRRELLPRHRKALRLSHRHDVRDDRGVSDRCQKRGRRGSSREHRVGPNPNFEVRIVDADGNPQPAGTVGEIACRAQVPARDERRVRESR